MMLLKDAQIGGGMVLRAFTNGERRVMAGAVLSGDEIRAMPNRLALIDKRYIDPWPANPNAADTLKGERHVVHRGGGQFDVIAGVRLNAKALSKDEAEDLATRPE